jgi:hypothetical protein
MVRKKLKDVKTMIGGSFPIPFIYRKDGMVQTAEKALIVATMFEPYNEINQGLLEVI